MALLWFLGGSVLFFVTAGVLAGLSFRGKEQRRYQLTASEDAALQMEPAADNQPTADADEPWPSSLP